MLEQIVIVGAGQAAASAIDTLRRKGFRGKIALIGAEPWLPYQRPPLSKKYLAGALERERLWIRPPSFYAEHGVATCLGRVVAEIDRRAQRVRLDDGAQLPYDALLLATGSRPRQVALPGTELAGVHYLRSLGDVDRMRADLRAGARLVVVGGGYIGLEVAATAAELGIAVTVLELAPRVMSRVTCEPVATFYQQEHASHGVRIVCGSGVREIVSETRDGRVTAVIGADGVAYPADAVLIGVGVLPEDSLARAAGLACGNGILVDEHCRTSDPLIYAAGDCAEHPNPHYGTRVRIESVDNAFEQGASAAANLLGQPVRHDKVPWFWSDQYDLKLVIVGLCQGHDAVVMRGSPAQRSFSACYLRAGELIAIDAVNAPKDQMAARKLIAARARPDPDRLADAMIPLKELG